MRASTILALLGLPLLAPAAGCKRGEAASGVAPASSDGASRQVEHHAAPEPVRRGEIPMPEGPLLGVIAGQANIFAEPSSTSRRLGYLRLGTVVKREPEIAGKAGCPGGWYKIQPRGYVCAGDEATTERDHPIVKAASIVRPQLDAAMPYRYGFVRAVLPLYLRVPTADEQYKSEMSLKEHLERWDAQKDELNKVVLGSYDVPLDERGIALLNKKLGDVPHPSTSQGQGFLFGANGEDDPIPWWLEGGRKIPNLADFKVPPYAVFADRARRHTGLSFVGSFPTGSESLNRRFAITTDLRLAPVSKVKPDTGSPWHGLDLSNPAKAPPLPFAWVRTSDAKAYKMSNDGKPRERGALEKRSVVMLTGRKVSGPDGFYWELKNGLFIKANHAGVVRTPDEWPEAAKKGQKWIEVSIDNQTLTLWEGQKPVFATMVSTGQDGKKDPKTTKSTVQGSFTIQSKHVTATMDSNEGSGSNAGPKKSSGGGKASEGEKNAKKGGGEKFTAAVSKTAEKRAVDPEYGVTKRRGEGTFWLRDVPYVQFFEKAYALHVAYWHDVFGIARSHGCINLAPVDGRFINSWTDPQIPEGWHGVFAGPEAPGTTIIVHE
ncbi:MAG: L,D-transpeptidase family protein [Polyangiaceae bacterium]|jgi:lipoprotein-anchoring transpeptidase ErfK/SrfK|nr:L,D-transpeptidase family protein [Polyangiaceae bacterium]